MANKNKLDADADVRGTCATGPAEPTNSFRRGGACATWRTVLPRWSAQPFASRDDVVLLRSEPALGPGASTRMFGDLVVAVAD